MQGSTPVTAHYPPEHVAIIMDGNGRWAAARGKPRKYGHRQGIQAVRDCVTGAADLGIKNLTLYSFSTENWRRPEDEISALFELLRLYVKQDLSRLDDEGVCIRVLGSRRRLDSGLIELIEKAEKTTKNNTRLNLNIAFNYGGRDEIVRAASRLARAVADGQLSVDEIDEKAFSAALDTAVIPDPDLVIRTSGEMRLSNFLLWQSAYAEFIVLDVLWPDFTKKDLQNALEIFEQRERRRGGVMS